MNQLTYKIGKNDAINRWWVTDVKRVPFESPYKTFEAEVNLGEAYVQVVYPVREAFLKANKINSVQYYEGKYDTLYFPFENNRVEFTDFIHVPHHIYFYGKTSLISDKHKTVSIDMFTCGGVKLWLNKREVTCFAPYTRNIPAKTRIELELVPGENELVVYAEELAERDVFFYFEMRNVGDEVIVGVLPIEEEPLHINNAEEWLKSCYFPRDLYREGQLTMNYTLDSVINNFEVELSSVAFSNKSNPNGILKCQVSDKKTEFFIGYVSQFKVGTFKVNLSVAIGSLKISRLFVVGIYPNNFIKFEAASTIKGRKLQALEFISEHGEEIINRSIAIIESKGELTEQAKEYLYRDIDKIREKRDCADFCLVPMFLMLTKYRNYLDKSTLDDIKETILDFRYWIDEPGNDVMWYFSENHAMLFHVSQYLAGYFFQNETFTVSGKKGSEQYRIGKERLINWFSIFEKYGYAEWNSITYIPIDLIGFFVLLEIAPDEEIRLMAKKALNFTFKVIAYNNFNGIISSSYGRVYEETLKARELTEPNFLEWVTSKKGFVNYGTRAVSLYSISSYEPAEYNEEYVNDNHEGRVLQYKQGINEVYNYLYKTNDYAMGSAIRFKPFTHGHQQHTMNIASGNNSIQFFINHPGERLFSGGGRPSYWAGNGTLPYIEQYKNVMLMIYDIQVEELVHYIHAYVAIELYDEFEIKDNWVFARTGDSYLGVWFSNKPQITREGANTNKEIISYGLHHEVIAVCGSKMENRNYESFKEQLLLSEITTREPHNLKFIMNKDMHFEMTCFKEFKFNGKEIKRDADYEMKFYDNN